MRVLVLNAGSSSLKAVVWEGGPIWRQSVDLGSAPSDTVERVLRSVPGGAVDAVGHRVVNGGEFQQSTRITAEVRAGIARAAEFAPEHNKLELAGIDAAERMFPGVPQFAVFDTAFHASMPDQAKLYPGPYAWFERGIRRFGFHGISHRYVSRRAVEMSGGRAARLITCHLGNGASLAAVKDGQSIDTTMGFTPLDGLMMGTRSGSVDPSILIYLLRHGMADVAGLDRLLNEESGLKGVSGISGDMRQIEAAMARADARARLAFEVYVHRLCREAGGMAASLGGVDALVFTGGVGENSAAVRAAACAQLRFLGVELDEEANGRCSGDCDLAAARSQVRVLVVKTDEDGEIARECLRLLA